MEFFVIFIEIKFYKSIRNSIEILLKRHKQILIKICIETYNNIFLIRNYILVAKGEKSFHLEILFLKHISLLEISCERFFKIEKNYTGKCGNFNLYQKI